MFPACPQADRKPTLDKKESVSLVKLLEQDSDKMSWSILIDLCTNADRGSYVCFKIRTVIW